MDYKNKYLKYKNKYLQLKTKVGGSGYNQILEDQKPILIIRNILMVNTSDINLATIEINKSTYNLDIITEVTFNKKVNENDPLVINFLKKFKNLENVEYE